MSTNESVCVCFSTGVWVYAKRWHSGVFVHEAVCDSAIRALVSIHSMNLQNKCPHWLVFQDGCTLSVLLTLRRTRQWAEGEVRSIFFTVKSVRGRMQFFIL